jgi:hypothetical protein
MDTETLWQKALAKTEIYRARIRYLSTFEHTMLPYIYLGESSINPGDVIVRKGKVLADKPVIFLPGNFPQFEGFGIDATFLMMRGISFPTMKYSNEIYKLDVIPGPLAKAIERYKKELEKSEDVSTGLIISPEDCWQFAVLIYACGLMAKSVPQDIRNILKRMNIENN